MKKCMVHNCLQEAVVTEEVILRGKRMVLTVCSEHYELVQAVKEEKALKREQAAERRRWGDPQRAIG